MSDVEVAGTSSHPPHERDQRVVRVLLEVLAESVLAAGAMIGIAYWADAAIWWILPPVLAVLAVTSYETASAGLGQRSTRVSHADVDH